MAREDVTIHPRFNPPMVPPARTPTCPDQTNLQPPAPPHHFLPGRHGHHIPRHYRRLQPWFPRCSHQPPFAQPFLHIPAHFHPAPHRAQRKLGSQADCGSDRVGDLKSYKLHGAHGEQELVDQLTPLHVVPGGLPLTRCGGPQPPRFPRARLWGATAPQLPAWVGCRFPRSASGAVALGPRDPLGCFPPVAWGPPAFWELAPQSFLKPNGPIVCLRSWR